MSVKIVRNDLEGMCAVPKSLIYINTEPFMIEEITITMVYNLPLIFIKGKTTAWFRADLCFIGDITECTDYLDLQQNLNAWDTP